jgi:hypothetical protein
MGCIPPPTASASACEHRAVREGPRVHSAPRPLFALVRALNLYTHIPEPIGDDEPVDVQGGITPTHFRKAPRIDTHVTSVHLDPEPIAVPFHHEIEAVGVVQHHLFGRTHPKRHQDVIAAPTCRLSQTAAPLGWRHKRAVRHRSTAVSRRASYRCTRARWHAKPPLLELAHVLLAVLCHQRSSQRRANNWPNSPEPSAG